MSSALSLLLQAGMPPLPLAMLWVSAWSPRCLRNAGSLSLAVGIWSPLAPWHEVHLVAKTSLPWAEPPAPPPLAAAVAGALAALAAAAGGAVVETPATDFRYTRTAATSSALSLVPKAGMPPLPLVMVWVSARSPFCVRKPPSVSFAVGIWSPLAPWHAVQVDPKMSLPLAATSAPPPGWVGSAAAGGAGAGALAGGAAAGGALTTPPPLALALGVIPACDSRKATTEATSSVLSLPPKAGMPPLPEVMICVNPASPRCWRKLASFSFAVGSWSPLAPWHVLQVVPKTSLPCAGSGPAATGAAVSDTPATDFRYAITALMSSALSLGLKAGIASGAPGTLLPSAIVWLMARSPRCTSQVPLPSLPSCSFDSPWQVAQLPTKSDLPWLTSACSSCVSGAGAAGAAGAGANGAAAGAAAAGATGASAAGPPGAAIQ